MVGRIQTMSTQVTDSESRYKSTVKTKARKTNNVTRPCSEEASSRFQNNMEVD